MDNIKATYNIDSKLWEFELIPETPMSNEVQIAFCSDAGPAEFSNLRFGYEINDTEKTLPGEAFLFGSVFPKAGIVYETAQTGKPLTIDSMAYRVDTNYKLTIWAENNGERGEGEFTFKTPKPPQEFPSWTWDDTANAWVAPVPKPVNGPPSWWNEQTQEWVEITDPNLMPLKPLGFDSWTWSAEENSWVPPVAKPESDVPLKWDEATLSWIPTSPVNE